VRRRGDRRRAYRARVKITTGHTLEDVVILRRPMSIQASVTNQAFATGLNLIEVRRVIDNAAKNALRVVHSIAGSKRRRKRGRGRGVGRG